MERFRSMSNIKKIVIFGVLGLVIIGAVLAIIFSRGYYATTMRILRIEGTVTVEDANGNEKPITDNMRFGSGEAVNTAAKSLASIGLDDHKVVTLQENSRAEFKKAGNKLELNLTEGGIFFEVDKPLEEDETFDVRTSTMVVGIRGTSGYVYVDSEGHECLLLTDGKVHIVGTNPVTGEKKEVYVTAGQNVRVYLYNDRDVDSIMFELEEFTEADIPEFARAMVLEDEDLLNKVCEDAGWDPDLIANGNLIIEVVDDAEIKVANYYKDSINIKAPSIEQKVGNLSGGNQQKVQLAKWMFVHPKVLILDEPTRGIDVGAKFEIYTLMNKLVEQGMSIIMISSELPEVLGMSDRLYVMSEGTITGELSREEATEEKVMALAIKSKED